MLAIALASGSANAVCKPLLPRRRPAAAELPAYQTLASPPTSSSFPSGHAASAAAFATAVGLESPRLGLALAPLAAAVGYSRVHVGVHWASDVAAGAALGVGVAGSPGAGGRCAAPTRRGPGRSTACRRSPTARACS